MEQWKDQKERKNKGRIKGMKEQWKEWNNGTMERSKVAKQWKDQKQWEDQRSENNVKNKRIKNNGRIKGVKIV